MLVLGAGKSGCAAAELLRRRGACVTLADEGASAAAAAPEGVVMFRGGAKLPAEDFRLCVASPAFAPGHPWLVQCRERGIGIVSELELGAAYWKAAILAVTGSKGKSSIVKLCSDTLNLHGIKASPAGNYGIPLCDLAVREGGERWAVTEVSSFQMENTENFAPRIGILLNVQPDHLDRHGSMQEYRALKLRMFSGMQPGSLALVHETIDPGGSLPAGVRLCRFGSGEGCDWRWHAGVITGGVGAGAVSISTRGSWFDNPVFGVSAAAAAAALTEIGLSPGAVEKGVREFSPLAHRMEHFLRSGDGVTFVDDSKGTSLSAMTAALKMVQPPVYLIAGGLLKEKLCENTKELLTQRAKKVYLIGDSCDEMFQAWSDAVACVKCRTLERAVDAAVGDAGTGATVLLSPGTASFDQFENYCERGERFKELVRKVAN